MIKLDGTLLTGIVLGAAFVTTGGAVAGFGIAAGNAPRYAEVVDVRPVKRTVRVEREVCVDVGETKRAATKSAAARQEAAAKRRCRSVPGEVDRVVAYDVRYRLGTTIGEVRLPEAPGERVLVQNGRVRAEAPTPGAESVGEPASG